MKDKGEAIILAGDFNEPLTLETSTTAKICQDINLVDMMNLRHPAIPEPATFIRGTKRIDYFLISESILPAVQACGYDPFHFRLQSDHRGMLLDLHTPTAFGNATAALASIPSRDLRSKDAAAVTKYITAKHSHLHANNFFTHLDTLLESPEFDLPTAEKLDALLVQATVHAGKQCRARRRDWWSQTLTIQRTKANLLRRLLSGYKNGINVRSALLAQIEELQITFDLPPTFDSCNAALRQAQLDTLALTAKQKELRNDELESSAEVYSMQGKADKQSNVQSMANQEQLSQIFSRIQSIGSAQSSRGQFTSLQIPTSWPTPDEPITNIQALPDPKAIQQDESQWRTVELPSDILYYLRLRNRLHFGQAQGTPFTEPPLSESLDWEASTKTSDLILDGDYDDNTLDDIQQLMLKNCKH
jgi:hypothetical protein